MTGKEALELWRELQTMTRGVPVELMYDAARREYVATLMTDDGEITMVGHTLAQAVWALAHYDEDEDEDDDA